MTTATTTAIPSRLPFPRSRRTALRHPGDPRPPCPFRRRWTPTECLRGEQVQNPCSSSSSSEGHRGTVGSRCAFYGRRFFFLATAPLLLSREGSSEYSNANSLQAVEPDESLLVRTKLRKVLSKSKAPGVLRLAFHDAGTFDMNDNTGGMNGSIILELDRPENAGLRRSVKILEKAKSELDKVQNVSWADLVAVAGAEAVSLCGGPVIPVQLGRMDTSIPDPEGKLPQETLGAFDLKKCFLEKGFSTQELVILSGAHTLGGKGFGSPIVFDNTYYKILLERPWVSSVAGSGPSMSSMIGLPSDHALVEDAECLRWITIYAADERRFFEDFKRAYVKLVNTGASWRDA